MAIKKIESYQASDGKLFTDKKEARAYERELARHAAVMDFANSVVFHGMDGGDLAEALENRGDEISLKLYNKLYELPKVLPATVLNVRVSNQHGSMTMPVVVPTAANEDMRDALVNMAVAVESKRNADLMIDSVIKDTSRSVIYIGMPEL